MDLKFAFKCACGWASQPCICDKKYSLESTLHDILLKSCQKESRRKLLHEIVLVVKSISLIEVYGVEKSDLTSKRQPRCYLNETINYIKVSLPCLGFIPKHTMFFVFCDVLTHQKQH